MRGDLGTGMADLLVTSLMKTERFTLVERADLDAILSELDLQRKGITREEGKIPAKRIMNVQYLIKGTITDFNHISMGSLGVGVKSTHIGGRGSEAIVSLVIMVVDVETGEILLSTTASSKVYGRGFDFAAAYNDISFGGQTFYRTPLGKATRAAIEQSVKEIVKTIGNVQWQPAIISIQDDRIVINGGKDRRVKPGSLYRIIAQGERIYDTETGDYLGATPGDELGIIEVTEIFDKFSYARLVEGECGEIGFRLSAFSSQETYEYQREHADGLK